MTPIFIISFNRLTVLKRMVEHLVGMGQTRIVIVDNASTYGPLLDYYELVKKDFDIIRMKGNYGHEVMKAVWDDVRLRIEYRMEHENYIYSDGDIVPVEECPNDFVEKFNAILEEYEIIRINKVGFGLKIDDLPATFSARDALVKWEQQYWRNPRYNVKLGVDLYTAAIDTTFACQRANTRPGYSYPKNSFRTGPPYVARHLPWYIDTEHLTEEDRNYIETANEQDTHFPGRYGKEPEA